MRFFNNCEWNIHYFSKKSDKNTLLQNWKDIEQYLKIAKYPFEKCTTYDVLNITSIWMSTLAFNKDKDFISDSLIGTVQKNDSTAPQESIAH